MSDKTQNTQVDKPAEAARTPALIPAVDVVEDAQGITLYADLPGVPKDKLDLSVDADSITIEGRLSLDVPEGVEVTHAEVSIPQYRRVFTLSKELDSTKVAAEFNNGVLKLRIPKAEHAQPRKVQIRVN
jgi:HSP20 family protein